MFISNKQYLYIYKLFKMSKQLAMERRGLTKFSR